MQASRREGHVSRARRCGLSGPCAVKRARVAFMHSRVNHLALVELNPSGSTRRRLIGSPDGGHIGRPLVRPAAHARLVTSGKREGLPDIARYQTANGTPGRGRRGHRFPGGAVRRPSPGGPAAKRSLCAAHISSSWMVVVVMPAAAVGSAAAGLPHVQPRRAMF